jgi:hypothetical protein
MTLKIVAGFVVTSGAGPASIYRHENETYLGLGERFIVQFGNAPRVERENERSRG